MTLLLDVQRVMMSVNMSLIHFVLGCAARRGLRADNRGWCLVEADFLLNVGYIIKAFLNTFQVRQIELIPPLYKVLPWVSDNFFTTLHNSSPPIHTQLHPPEIHNLKCLKSVLLLVVKPLRNSWRRPRKNHASSWRLWNCKLVWRIMILNVTSVSAEQSGTQPLPCRLCLPPLPTPPPSSRFRD